ncbi:hypothetical protein [uncultured Gimesia sp.]|uniref:hypothetical protein n=1 Tax=uncultured Gimesia sp. TaxID=1678688 RepID=UPI0030DCD7DE|tara:strand:+ start:103223 stop:105358 length:2136 start_codon:yes stop_codon:yes gene_type:complete
MPVANTTDYESVGSVIYPGIKQIVSASYSRSHGITPDVCQIEMAPQTLDAKDSDYVPIEPDGYLLFRFDTAKTVTDGNGISSTTNKRVEILMQSCRPDKASVRRSATSINWTIPIYDRRWKWKFGSFSGHWNIKKNGVIEKRKEKTPRELADMCLDAMRETNYETKALDQLEKLKKLPYRKQVRPEVHWDRIPPAQALNELVTPLGYRVCLGWDEVVRIEKFGEGAFLPTSDLMSGGFDAQLPESPDSITVLGGITMHEAMWELEAVGLDLDGDWRPIDYLSYAPRYKGEVDWRRTQPGVFDELKQRLEDVEDNLKPKTDLEYRKLNEQHGLATSTVYRCYRLKYPVGTDEGFSNRTKVDTLGKLLGLAVDFGARRGDSGYDKLAADYEEARRELFKKAEPVIPGPQIKNPRTGRLGDYKLEGFEQVLPCFETRAELAIDSYTGKLIRKPVEVTGIYFDDNKAWNVDRPDTKKIDGTKVSVMPELGIIRFSEPIFKYQKGKINIDGETKIQELTYPADLRVLIATPLKNLAGEPARYEHREELSPKYRTKPAKLPSGLQGNPRKQPRGTDTKVIIKKEIVQAYQAQYETKKNPQGKVETKLVKVVDNADTEELEKQALSAIDVENIKIFTKDSGSGVYAGLKKIDLDGAIQQVAITRTTSGGMTTTIARNTEVNIYVPDFDERQRNIALKEMIKNHNETVDKTEQVEPKDK